MSSELVTAGEGEGATTKRAGAPCVTVVGVGASAGGIEPVCALLHALSPDAPVAVVVVMHLDPTHDSALSAILGRATAMPVAVAVEGARVECGHAYVIPPNVSLRIVGGALRLTTRTAEAGRNLPIDAFLRSLADDAPGRCMAVVLSGTGSDGALGVRAVREAGGATFAQDATAAHEDMPLAAAATGCVDFVLPPDAIAREVLRVAAAPPPDDVVTADDESLLQQVFARVRAAGGADFASYKRSSVLRRVLRRVQITHHASLRDYVAFLRDDPDEAAALGEDVLIHVTSFFRDPTVFDALKESVLPKLLARGATPSPIRVWVPGCSTGEELYSLAICLLEFLSEAGASNPVQLFGTDVSATAIERARAGRYVDTIEADVSPARLQRFFVKSEGSYQIRRDVRDLCVFARHDVTRDPSFSGVDLVSCRNLMIYLDASLQGRVLQIFHYALKADGFLLLGGSETVGGFAGFTPVNAKARIFARTGPPTRRLHDQRPRTDYDLGAPPPGPTAQSQAVVQRESDRAVLLAHAPPGVVVTDDRTVVLFRGDAGPYVAPTPGAASLDILRLVRPDLRVALRRCLEAAVRSGRAERVRGPRGEPGAAEVEVEVLPFTIPPSNERLFVVHFLARPRAASRATTRGRAPEPTLRDELATTREYLQSIIAKLEANNEALGAANEQAVSANEELRSTNEEFQLAKEELQASNEELATVNGELVERNAEATRLNDDLMNLFASVAIPIVILGRDGRIRRFTPSAGRVLGIIATDLGRPMTDLRPRLVGVSLAAVIADVQRTLAPQEHPVIDEVGHWHQLAVRPYRTGAGGVDGVTITLFDLAAIKRDEWAREAEYQEKLQRASFDAVVAEERERHRIATELHDHLGQSLAYLQMQLTAMRDEEAPASRQTLDACVRLVARSIAETRTLTFDLSPPILYDLGLDAAVVWLSDQFAARHELRVTVENAGAGALDPDVAAVLFRAVRELLANVVKHARSDAARVSLRRDGASLTITVDDEGVGIEGAPDAPDHGGFGLFSVREQVRRLGGTLDVVSSTGAGTHVTLRVPIVERPASGAPEAP